MNGTGISPADLGNERQILPLVMYHLTPSVVGYIGLGVITAAVMSSADSVGLSFGGEFGRNIYRPILRPQVRGKCKLFKCPIHSSTQYIIYVRLHSTLYLQFTGRGPGIGRGL